LLAKQGAAVVVSDSGVEMDGTGGSEEPARETVAEITRAGGKARADFKSVADWDAARELIDTTLKDFGHIDILINTAGLSDAVPIWDLTKEHFQRIVSSSVDGTFNCIRHVSRHMMERRYGRIVNFLSRGGLNAMSSVSAYAVAKAGVYGLTNSVSCDLAHHGIMVNGVFPGPTRTRMVTEVLKNATDSNLIARRDALILAAQPPEYVAAMVVYLSSEACRFAGEYFLVERNSIGRFAPLTPEMYTKQGTDPWTLDSVATAVAALDVKQTGGNVHSANVRGT
jgi:NAD(P)-dependent dehydrogenase (short-subunit alcohol dehydrogenase family)